MTDDAAPNGGVLGRARGCLLGQLAGDALGSLVEFQSPEQIRRRYPEGVRIIADGGTWGTMAGQPTDDSEMALALGRALADTGCFDLERVAAAYARWYASVPFDTGGTCHQALSAADQALCRGEPAARASQAAASRDSQANGALMRISPLAVFGAYASEDAVVRWAREDASLSHPHPVCMAANAAFVAATSRAIREQANAEHAYAVAIRVAAAQPDAVTVYEALLRAAEAPPSDFMACQGWVCLALQNAFHQLLHAASFEEGVVDTVGRGGDTDTNAAIAGALLGAVHGADAVPAQWRECLAGCRPSADNPRTRHPRPEEYWPCDALELAERLLTARSRK